MALLLLLKRRRKRLALQRKRKRKYWVRSVFRRREEYGEFHRPIEELGKKAESIFSGKATGKILHI